MDNDNKEIRVTSHGGREGNISISGFDEIELEKMLAAMTAGAYYITVENGKFKAIPKWKELPKPTEDKEMLPFWRKHSESTQAPLFDDYEHSKEKGRSPSITIQHLCGYFYSEKDYKWYAERLESYGFICLRSRRETDAKFWEIWYLSGLWAAKNDLADTIKRGETDSEKLKLALELLRQKVSFGTLDVSSQRICAVID